MFRNDPFSDFDRFFGTVGRPTLPLDAVRREHEVEVRIDLPGVSPDDIDVRIEDHTLSVRAERLADAADGETVLIAERRFGVVHRRLRLTEELDTDELVADYSNGVLTITIPVRASATPRRIEIATATAALAEPATA